MDNVDFCLELNFLPFFKSLGFKVGHRCAFRLIFYLYLVKMDVVVLFQLIFYLYFLTLDVIYNFLKISHALLCTDEFGHFLWRLLL